MNHLQKSPPHYCLFYLNINDALNGIVYPDDKQITSLVVNKYYAIDEQVEVRITDDL